MHYHLVGSSAHPSAIQSCPEPTKKKRMRLLRKEEHSVVQDIDKAAVLLNVRRSVPMGSCIILISRALKAVGFY